MSPAIQVHVHIPTWLAVVAVVFLLALLLWEVLSGQSIRDQVDAATEAAGQAKATAATARLDARRAIDHMEATDVAGGGRHHRAADPGRPRSYPHRATSAVPSRQDPRPLPPPSPPTATPRRSPR